MVAASGGCFVCLYARADQDKPPLMTVLKKQVSKDLLKQMHREHLRSMNQRLNSKLEEKTRIIVGFLENTAQINVKRASL